MLPEYQRLASSLGIEYFLNKSLDYMGNPSLDTNTNTYEIVAGIRGDLGVKDWTYDFFGARGNTNQSVHYTGFADLARGAHGELPRSGGDWAAASLQ